MPNLKEIEPYYRATVEVAEEFRKELTPVPALDNYQHMCCAYFVKAYRSYQAIYDLVSNGHELDAEVVARANFEIMVQMSYLLEGAEKPAYGIGRRAGRLRLDNSLQRYRHYEETKSWKKAFLKPAPFFDEILRRHRSQDDWKTVLRDYSRWAAKQPKKKKKKKDGGDKPSRPKPPNYWIETHIKPHCVSMSRRTPEQLKYRAAFLGQKWAEFYLKMYKEETVFAHSLPLSFEFYVEKRDGRYYYKFDPSLGTNIGIRVFDDASRVFGVIMYYLAFALKKKESSGVFLALNRLGELRNEKSTSPDTMTA